MQNLVTQYFVCVGVFKNITEEFYSTPYLFTVLQFFFYFSNPSILFQKNFNVTINKMNTKFIFLLIFTLFVLHNSTTTVRSMYVWDNEHQVNEDEIGKEKRSSEDDQCSDDFFVTNIKKDLTDFDYRNGNAEPDADDHEAEDLKNVKKRETEVIAGKILFDIFFVV